MATEIPQTIHYVPRPPEPVAKPQPKDDEQPSAVNADERLARHYREQEQEYARQRAIADRKAKLERPGIAVSPMHLLDLDEPANRTRVHAEALAAVTAHRRQTDAAAAQIVDGWMAESRFALTKDGRVLAWCYVPAHGAATRQQLADRLGVGAAGSANQWLERKQAWHTIEDFARLMLSDANPEAELARRQSMIDAEVRRMQREAIEAAQAETRNKQRKDELERRAELWRNVRPDIRAFLRHADDPEHGALFAAIARVLAAEPGYVKPNEQPPASAHAFLGIWDGE